MEDHLSPVKLFVDKPALVFPNLPSFRCEDICVMCAQYCDIKPITRHLFSLYDSTTKVWIAPCEKFTREALNGREFVFKLRFTPPEVSTLQLIDLRALEYYYNQIHHDFVNNTHNIPSSAKNDVLGLAVLGMFCDALSKCPRGKSEEMQKIVDTLYKDFKSYLPPKCLKQYELRFLHKYIQESLHDLIISGGTETSSIQERYIQGFQRLFENYPIEEYCAMRNFSGDYISINIRIVPSENGCKLWWAYPKKKPEWQLLCGIEDLCFVTSRADLSLEIARKNGIPIYLSFVNKIECLSFISCLDGYYRLTEKWCFNLCSDVYTPSLFRLKSMKCHGPVGVDFSSQKLKSKTNYEKGSFLIRESHLRYNLYWIDVCEKSGLQPTSYKVLYLCEQNSWNLEDFNLMMDSLPKLIERCVSLKLINLNTCVPPSEYDISPLLLCRVNLGSISAVSHRGHPVLFQGKELTFSDSCKLQGKSSVVHYGKFKHNYLEKTNCVIKVPKDLCRVNKVLEVWDQCCHWNCDSLVAVYGVILCKPMGLVMEQVSLGRMDLYLEGNRFLIYPRNLVEASLYLARALWYLDENGLRHGHIRCRKLLVVAHDDVAFRVKLGDPGLGEYTSDDIHWVPVEYHGNLTGAAGKTGVDLWAVGTTIWEIINYGVSPVDRIKDNPFQFYQTGGNLPAPSGSDFSLERLYRLIVECWLPDPASRKQPSSLYRDINQLWYEVYHSANNKSYAVIDSEGTSLMSERYDEEENLIQFSVSTQFTKVSEDGAYINENLEDDYLPVKCAGDSRFGLWNDVSGLCLYDQHYTSGSIASFDSSILNVSSSFVIELNQLEFISELGRGCYGEVHKAKLKLQDGLPSEVVAVKKLRTGSGPTAASEMMQEIDIMKTLRHPNIVEVKGMVEDPQLMLVMEYLAMGSLLVYLGANRDCLTNAHLLKYCLDVAQGMAYLGTKKIVHRDLAARNILVYSKDLVKISDFGLSRILNAEKYYLLKTNRELPIKWYALESILYRKFSSSSDVWSFGVTVYEMFSFGLDPKLPECDDKSADDICRTLEKGIRLPCPEGCPVDVYSRLMRPCWELDSHRRPSFSSLCLLIVDLMEKTGNYE